MLICGSALAFGLAGRCRGGADVFVLFMLGAGVYGAFGSASPPRGPGLYRGAHRRRRRATAALAALLLLRARHDHRPGDRAVVHLPAARPRRAVVRLRAIGLGVLAAIVLRLPDDTPTAPRRRRAIVAYPSIGGSPTGASASRDGRAATARGCDWRDPRVLPWLIAGVVGGHGQAALLAVIGFLVIDRLQLPLAVPSNGSRSS